MTLALNADFSRLPPEPRKSSRRAEESLKITREQLVEALALRIEAGEAKLATYSEADIAEAYRWLEDRDERLWK